MDKTNKGITLIALVITIIVLLILAGISIASLTGENGILTKGEISKTKTKEETAKEEVKLAWTSLTADYYEGVKGNKKADYYTKQNLNEELKQTGEITEFNYQENGITSLVYVKSEQEEYYMEIETTGDITIKEKEKEGTITKVKQGDYIQYIDKNKTKINCMVLYDSSSSYGIQIVTLDTLEEVTLGEETYEEAKKIWDQSREILDNKAKEYVNEDYAATARCLGGLPNGTLSSNWEGGDSYPIIYLDRSYEEDYQVLQKLNISNINKSYWLASRMELTEETSQNSFLVYAVRSINEKGEIVLPNDWQERAVIATMDEYLCAPAVGNVITKGLRAVFMLKKSIDIQGGDGTLSNPYTLQ